jgi:hypothetical protein
MKAKLVPLLVIIGIMAFGQSRFDDTKIHNTLLSELQTYFDSQDSWPLIVGGLLYNGNATKLGAVLQNSISSSILEAGIEIPVLGELRTQIIRETGINLDNALEPRYALSGRADLIEERVKLYYFLTDLERGTMVKSFEFSYPYEVLQPLLSSSGGVSSGDFDLGEPDDLENPRDLENATAQRLSFHNPEDRDYFLVENTFDEPQVLTFETLGSLDTMIVLYEGDDREIIAENDDSGEDNNARLVRVLPGGFFGVIGIAPYDEDETGEYSISYTWEEVPEMEYEPNEDPDTAFSIGVGEILDLNFFPRGDEDWFRLTVPELGFAGALSIYTLGESDTVLEVYDREGILLYENDDSGEEITSQVLAFPDEEIIFIRVREYNGEIGDYGLAVEIIEIEIDEYEPDNSPEQATTIGFDQPQSHGLIPTDDEDWFRFILPEESQVLLRTLSSIDTRIELYDGSMTLLGQDDDGGDGLNALLRTNLGAGEYFFKVDLVSTEPEAKYDVILSLE